LASGSSLLLAFAAKDRQNQAIAIAACRRLDNLRAPRESGLRRIRRKSTQSNAGTVAVRQHQVDCCYTPRAVAAIITI
jgi:hypothetical protein